MGKYSIKSQEKVKVRKQTKLVVIEPMYALSLNQLERLILNAGSVKTGAVVLLIRSSNN